MDGLGRITRLVAVILSGSVIILAVGHPRRLIQLVPLLAFLAVTAWLGFG